MVATAEEALKPGAPVLHDEDLTWTSLDGKTEVLRER